MNPVRPRVILRNCDDYVPEKIQRIVREGLEELNLHPTGRTLIKPNLVMGLKGVFDYAFTRSEFFDGLVGAVKECADPGLTEIALGERGGITVPTRLMFTRTGYSAVVRKHKIKHYLFDEVTQVPVQLRHPDRLRDLIFAPEPVVKADFFINAPKLKAHPWTTVTVGAKNYIGLQDDRHRLIDHDHRLDEKIADLQELIQPQFLCVDAIIAGEGQMLTPDPYPMNLIIMGNNQPALDSVCSHILGLDPMSIGHIRLCAERGYGTVDLDEIEISGDVSLEAAQERAKNFKVGRIRVEDYFRDSPIQAHAGPPSEPERTDYCWGGCPGALEEAIDIIKVLEPDVYERMKPLTMVFGAYEGEIDLRKGEKAVFIGDCACWKGKLHDHDVEIPSLYVDRHLKDPRQAKMTDVFIKMARVYWTMFVHHRRPYFRVPGCPVSVAEQVLVLASLGRTVNPYFAFKIVVPFGISWITWRLVKVFRFLTGKKYQSAALPEPAKATALPRPEKEE